MKFMNNHYGQARIFGNAKCKIPIDLTPLYEADGIGGGGGAGEAENSGDNEQSAEGNESPTIEELMTQLSETRAENAKLKLANDKSSKEAAGYKKQLQAKMSAEERASEVENERITALEEENKQMKAQMRMASYSKRYIGIGMDEKTADNMAELTGDLADADKFFSALDKFIQGKVKASGEDAIQNFLKDRPDIKAGSGTSENSLALEKAKELAKSSSGVNEDILKHYRR